MRLLVTRPQPDGECTAAALRARGHEALLAPLTRIEPIAVDLGQGPWAAILMTSANAARAVEIHPRRDELVALPLVAVGDRTADAARRAGFADVRSADGSLPELAALAAARYAGAAKPLLYLAGADRSGDLAAELAKAWVAVETGVIYQAVAQAVLPAAVTAALRDGTLDGVLHFSRRHAELFLRAAENAGLSEAALRPVHYCLSAQVAAPLAAAAASSLRIAAHPSESALLALLGAA